MHLIHNGTAQFDKCKQFLISFHLGTSCGKNFNLYLKVVHFFNTSVGWTSVAA